MNPAIELNMLAPCLSLQVTGILISDQQASGQTHSYILVAVVDSGQECSILTVSASPVSLRVH
jgi:hypothetical protein